jgi:acetylornithine deacetylase/succinyl-diaminopimelate desuccinylase-like protein
MPAGDLAAWRSDPWSLTGVNGFYYARGATDNKGPIMSEIFAVKELVEELRTGGDDGEMAMVNVAFVYEGEEESASEGLQEVLNTYRSWLCQGSARVAGILISNTYWVGDERPCLTYGMRGSIDLSVTISGPGRDLHSGVDGGAITGEWARSAVGKKCSSLSSSILLLTWLFHSLHLSLPLSALGTRPPEPMIGELTAPSCNH